MLLGRGLGGLRGGTFVFFFWILGGLVVLCCDVFVVLGMLVEWCWSLDISGDLRMWMPGGICR